MTAPVSGGRRRASLALRLALALGVAVLLVGAAHVVRADDGGDEAAADADSGSDAGVDDATDSGGGGDDAGDADADADLGGDTDGGDDDGTTFDQNIAERVGEDLACSACKVSSEKILAELTTTFKKGDSKKKKASAARKAIRKACDRASYSGWAISGQEGARAYVDFQKMMSSGALTMDNLKMTDDVPDDLAALCSHFVAETNGLVSKLSKARRVYDFPLEGKLCSSVCPDVDDKAKPKGKSRGSGGGSKSEWTPPPKPTRTRSDDLLDKLLDKAATLASGARLGADL